MKTYDFAIKTEKSTEVEVKSDLYCLLELSYDNGFSNIHRGSSRIREVIDILEDEGEENYNLTEEDTDLLYACRNLLDEREVDFITFVKEGRN